MQSVANRLAVGKKADEFLEEVDSRIKIIQNRLIYKASYTPSVLTIEWIDPIYVGGMWLPEMIKIAGGNVCIAKSGHSHYTL